MYSICRMYNIPLRAFAILLIIMGFSVSLNAQIVSSDFSSSPREGGASSNGYLEINWGDFASRVNVFLEKDTATTDETGFSPSLRSEKYERFQLDLIPYSAQILDKPLLLKAHFGISWNQIDDSFHSMFYDVNGWIANNPGDYVSVQNKRSGTLISPVIGVSSSLNIPDLPFRISINGFIYPIYYLFLAQTMRYDFLSNKVTNNVSRFSSPYLEYELNTQITNWVRIFFSHNYQRLDFQTFDWNSTGSDIEPKDDIQENNTINLGGDLTIPIKDSLKLSAGIFWEFTLMKSSYWKTLLEENNVRFKFGILF